MPICAYCEKDAILTREHVVPSFLYDLVDKNYIERKNGWLETKKIRIPTDIKVKDVCGDCNNVALSKLDAQGKKFLSSNKITSPILDKKININYDYDYLLRWLLKILFNSSRASQENTHPAEQYKKYILEGNKTPSQDHVFLFCYLLSPHVVKSPESLALRCSNKDNLANPFFVRITRSVLPEKEKSNLMLESIGFGGLFFYVGFISKDLKTKQAIKIRERIIRSDKCSLLSPALTSISLRASSLDFIDMLAPQQYREKTLNLSGRDPFNL